MICIITLHIFIKLQENITERKDIFAPATSKHCGRALQSVNSRAVLSTRAQKSSTLDYLRMLSCLDDQLATQVQAKTKRRRILQRSI